MKWLLLFFVVFAVTVWCTRVMLDGTLGASWCVGLLSMFVVAVAIRIFVERS